MTFDGSAWRFDAVRPGLVPERVDHMPPWCHGRRICWVSRPRSTVAAHVVVIGGGVAGLAAAREVLVARPDVRVTVLEGASEVGGKLRVGEVAGIPVDLGAESMLNRRPEGTELARAVGLGEHLVHPRVSGAGVWTRGAIRPLPPTLMGIPANLGVAADSGILTRVGLARAQLERGLPRLDLSEDVGIGRLVARRLGPQVRDRLVEPLLGGVYAGRSDEISTHAAMPQLVSAVSQEGSLLAAARGRDLRRNGTDPGEDTRRAGLRGHLRRRRPPPCRRGGRCLRARWRGRARCRGA